MFSFRTNLSILKGILTKKSPFYIQYFITNKCHLRCKMCNIVSSNEKCNPIDLEKIDKIAKNLQAIGAGVVLLTGGEPFLRDDIVQIVRIFTSYGLTPRLQTAGLIQKFDNMLKCNELGAKDINVSLDTLDEDLGDKINGVKGSWRNAILTIGKISREFPSIDTVCALGCVLSPYNIDHVEKVLDFAEAIGWSLSLVPAHINKNSLNMNFRGHDDSFAFKNEDYDKVKQLITRLQNRRQNGSIFDSKAYLESIVPFIETNSPSWRYNNICDSPNLYFAIRPDGSFAPCCDHDLPQKVYVYDDDFVSIYNSKEFHNSVIKITEKCTGCNFGSYPEMTLTARNFMTFVERVSLELRPSKISGRKYSDEELFSLIEAIRNK